MVPCREVILHLWEYLDGELPRERAQEIADHLAECARCYPQYRFEFGFLELIARQRDRSPPPPKALLERLQALVTG